MIAYTVYGCQPTFTEIKMSADQNAAADPKNSPVSIRLGDMDGLVRKRTPSQLSLANTVRRDLARYYEIIQDEDNRTGFDAKEAAALVDGVGHRPLDKSNWQLLWAMVEAYLRDHPEAGFSDAERSTFTERLRAMRTSELLRVVDSIERFRMLWENKEEYEELAEGNWDPREQAFFDARLTHFDLMSDFAYQQNEGEEDE